MIISKGVKLLKIILPWKRPQGNSSYLQVHCNWGIEIEEWAPDSSITRISYKIVVIVGLTLNENNFISNMMPKVWSRDSCAKLSFGFATKHFLLLGSSRNSYGVSSIISRSLNWQMRNSGLGGVFTPSLLINSICILMNLTMCLWTYT